MEIHFIVPLIPKAQKRDRIAVIGGHARSYKASEQSHYEAQVRVLINQYKPIKPIEGAIELHVSCFLPIPVSKSNKWKLAAKRGEIYPTGKPDYDNIAKNIGDIMEGIFYRNDSQIVKAVIIKEYSDNPRWEIIMNELGVTL